MGVTLELDLKGGEGKLRLVCVRFRDADTANKQWTSELFDEWDSRLSGVERDANELLPPWSTPQRALVVLLLCSSGSAGKSFVLRHPAHPYARSLFDAARRGQDAKGQPTWLQRIFGLANKGDAEKRRELIKDWLLASGSSSRNCAVRLGSRWRGACLIVRVDGAVVVPGDYHKYAHELELQTVDKAEASRTDTSLEMLVWDGSQSRFVPLRAWVYEGDRLQVRVRLMEPRFVFVVWVDQQGMPWSLYPWLDMKWKRVANLEPRDNLTIPDVPDGNSLGSLEIRGKSSWESIVVLCRSEPPGKKLLAALRRRLRLPAVKNMSRGLHRPVTSIFPRDAAQARPTASTRYPMRVNKSNAVVKLHGIVWERLRQDFQQLIIFTFVNAGPEKRDR